MLKLNRIAEDRAKQNADHTWGLLNRVLSQRVGPEAESRQSYHESAGRLSLKLGSLLYALEANPEEIWNLFRQAAKNLAPALALRERPDPDTHRNPWEAELFINVIGCFGDDEEWAAVATLQRRQYCNPERQDRDAVVRYLETVLRYMGGDEIDTATLAEVVQACGRPAASKEERLFLLPSARGLAAVAAGDEDGWNHALAQIVAAHAREARSGDLKLLPDGFISFRALMLAKFGMDQEMECRAQSDYLPLFLLEYEEGA